MTLQSMGIARQYLSILLLLSLFITMGCAEDKPLNDPPMSEPETRVYYENYDEVWRSIQLALRKYPVHLNNIDSGILETDYIVSDKLFADPVEGRTQNGMRYKIIIRAVKGKLETKSAIKVICTKVPEVQRDFFVGYQTIPTNGLEEKTILYRIGRYLEMEKMLSKISESH